jgi:hypothetical protein
MLMASSISYYSDEFWDSKSVGFQGRGKCLPAYWRDTRKLDTVL